MITAMYPRGARSFDATDDGVPVGSLEPLSYQYLSAQRCSSWSPDSLYICTRTNGHTGRHVAHGINGTSPPMMVLGVWGTSDPHLDVADGL